MKLIIQPESAAATSVESRDVEICSASHAVNGEYVAIGAFPALGAGRYMLTARLIGHTGTILRAESVVTVRWAPRPRVGIDEDLGTAIDCDAGGDEYVMGQIPFGHVEIGRDAWSGLGCLRQCRFRNICFDSAAHEFVLLSGPRLGQGSDIWMYALGRLAPLRGSLGSHPPASSGRASGAVSMLRHTCAPVGTRRHGSACAEHGWARLLRLLSVRLGMNRNSSVQTRNGCEHYEVVVPPLVITSAPCRDY